jgi:hypothetical protein
MARWSPDKRLFGVNRVTLAVCRSLPVCTQLQTGRCTALTDAMCQLRSFDLLVGTSARGSFGYYCLTVRLRVPISPRMMIGAHADSQANPATNCGY